MAEREAPQLPLRGARGSAAQFSAMALVSWASPEGVQTGVCVTPEGARRCDGMAEGGTALPLGETSGSAARSTAMPYGNGHCLRNRGTEGSARGTDQRGAPWSPLRGARGSAARFSVMNLVQRPGPVVAM